jgi:molybdate transport system substrate-binding protein
MADTHPRLSGISSMATRLVLAELTSVYQDRTGVVATIESVGGVDAARRVAAGEVFDIVLLAADAIAKLEAAGHVVAGSRVDLFRSGVAVAVRAGAAVPDIASEEALKQAVLAARSISLSTGPSGVALAQLFERWGIAGDIAPRMVQAPPGVPVGTLVAKGEVELGFQQWSELMHLDGIQVLGALPEPVRIVTTFSGAVCAASTQGAQVRALLQYLASHEVEETKRRHGMEPA